MADDRPARPLWSTPVVGAIAVVALVLGVVVGVASAPDAERAEVRVADDSSTSAPTSVADSTVPAPTTSSPVTTSPTTAPGSTAAPTSAAPTTSTPAAGATTSAATPTAPPSTAGRSATGLAGAVIVVDPGHNGANGSHTKEINALVDAGGSRKACNTTGTAAGSYAEAQFTWEVALQLAEVLRSRGATVVLTRTDNAGWGPCVDQRGLTAQRNSADLLLSIHADGSDAGNRGFHVISPGVVDGYTDTTAGPSAILAAAVRDALVAKGLSPANYVGKSGLVRRTDLGTLNRSGVPAVMLESGNMRDADDLAVLRSPEGQQRIAQALADGAAAFLSG